MAALLCCAAVLVGLGVGLDSYSNQLTPRDNWIEETRATMVTGASEETAITGPNQEADWEEEPTTMESTQEPSQPEEWVPMGNPEFWDIQENVKLIAAGIFLVGLVFAFVYSWHGEMEMSRFGPDLECLTLILLAVFLVLIRESVWYAPLVIMTAGMVLGGVGILLMRGIVQWAKQGYDARWCMCWRGGTRSGSVEKFFRLQFALMTLFLALGLGIIGEFQWLAVWVMFLSGFPIYCMMVLARDTDHFLDSVRLVCGEKHIQTGDGYFQQEERELAALQCSHAEAVKKAVAGERFKVELISNVSHDLRTPLTAILGYSELLGGENLSEEGAQRLEQLNKKAGYMKELVDDLFELTKVSSGVAEASFGKIDLIRLLEQTLGLLDDRLENANLQVRRHYQAPSLELQTDGNRMHQVFVNLIENAIKYALPGSRIHLYVSKQERTVVRLVNTASYEMDFTAQEIVERFARGDKARSSQGSGIGLAIAQTYTASVGGSFRVEIDGDQFSAIVELP